MAKLEVLTYGFTLITNQGSVGYSTNSLLTYGNQTILVDTGPPSRRGLLVESLKAKGMTPADVDMVILTHLHWDHCLNTDLFKNSRILVHPVELDYARNPNPGDHACATYVADMLARLKVEPVSEGDVIVDGLTIMDTPGHTKGHISVQADLDGEKTLIAGDALPDGGAVKRGLAIQHILGHERRPGERGEDGGKLHGVLPGPRPALQAGRQGDFLPGRPHQSGNHHVQRGWAGADDKLHGALGQGGQPQPCPEGLKEDFRTQTGNR